MLLSFARDFSARARGALEWGQGLLPNFAGEGGRIQAGAFATLSAVVVGAGMLAANIAHERHALAAEAAAPAPVRAVAAPAPVKAAAVAAKADPLAAIASPAAQAPAVAPQKMTARIDMTPTGSIAKEAAPKPRRKPHHKKVKPLDSDH